MPSSSYLKVEHRGYLITEGHAAFLKPKSRFDYPGSKRQSQNLVFIMLSLAHYGSASQLHSQSYLHLFDQKMIIVYYKIIIHSLLPLIPRESHSKLARNFKWQVVGLYFSRINHTVQNQWLQLIKRSRFPANERLVPESNTQTLHT